MKMTESLENYLETILTLSKVKPVVRAVDIADELNYKKSSISIALKRLREQEQVTVTKEGFIYLTPAGEAVAKTIFERHELISKWLMSLGVDEETAIEDACRMEHVISAESFAAIKNHVQKNK